MKTPPTIKPRRTITAMLDADPVKKGDTVGDFAKEGCWIMGVKEGEQFREFVPVTEITVELFARVHREFMRESKLHLFGQRRY